MKLKMILTAVLAVLLGGCALSTAELSEEVQASMRETFKQNGNIGITIKSLVLTNKGGNEYTGVLVTNEPIVGEVSYSVDVVYDGENMTWKIVD